MLQVPKAYAVFYGSNATTFLQQYKHKLGDFHSCEQKSHAHDYLIFSKNMVLFSY
jgi:hypothetical protein